MHRPMFLKSYVKRPANTSYEGEDHDEEIELLVRRSLVTVVMWLISFIIFFLIPIFLIPLLARLQYNGQHIFGDLFLFCFTLFWYIFTFGFAFQSFLNWYFEVLLVTNKKIVDIDRFCTSISETPLRNVQDVTSKIYGTWGHILNIGSIHIQTAAERGEFEFETVDNPSVVRDAISDLVSMERHRGIR